MQMIEILDIAATLTATKTPPNERAELTFDAQRIAAGLYVPDRVPPEAQRGSEGSRLGAAADVARGIHRTGPALEAREFAGEVTRAKREARRLALNNALRPKEEKALRAWAHEQGLMLDDAEFSRRWKEGGEVAGQENEVCDDEASQRVFKRNDLNFHSSWLEFFQRLQLQNWLFPEAPLTLAGFVDHNTKFQPIIAQPTIRGKQGAKRGDVQVMMKSIGFARLEGDDYLNEALGVRVEDVHGENAVVLEKGAIAVFDAAIYLDTGSKIDRIMKSVL